VNPGARPRLPLGLRLGEASGCRRRCGGSPSPAGEQASKGHAVCDAVDSPRPAQPHGSSFRSAGSSPQAAVRSGCCSKPRPNPGGGGTRAMGRLARTSPGRDQRGTHRRRWPRGSSRPKAPEPRSVGSPAPAAARPRAGRRRNGRVGTEPRAGRTPPPTTPQDGTPGPRRGRGGRSMTEPRGRESRERKGWGPRHCACLSASTTRGPKAAVLGLHPGQPGSRPGGRWSHGSATETRRRGTYHLRRCSRCPVGCRCRTRNAKAADGPSSAGAPARSPGQRISSLSTHCAGAGSAEGSSGIRPASASGGHLSTVSRRGVDWHASRPAAPGRSGAHPSMGRVSVKCVNRSDRLARVARCGCEVSYPKAGSAP